MREKNSLSRRIITAFLCITMMLALVSCGANAAAEQKDEPAAASGEKPAAAVLTAEAGRPDGKRVYFAGPMFSQGEKDFNLKLTEVLESFGYQVFLPQRDGLEAALLEGMTDEEKVKVIFEKDYNQIMEADIVFMLVDGRVPDEGACVELGMAYALGKRCYGVKTDTRSLEIDLDMNPLIGGCFIEFFKDFDGDRLIETLRQYLSENEL